MQTLVSRIEKAADSGRTITLVNGEDARTQTWAELHDKGRAAAAALQSLGIGPGSHVALVGPTTEDFVVAVQGVWLAGGCVVTLPLPMRMGSLDAFVAQTRDRVRAADAALVLVDPQIAPFISREEGDPPFVGLDELSAARSGRTADGWERPVDDPAALAVVQFTSGSTSAPKGVMLPHSVLGANIDAAVTAADVTPDDVLVSWLPLYHDMGLIGMLTISMATGASLVKAAPQDFLSRPGRWLQWISDYRGTITAGPNFAYALATRALKRATDLDLSSVEILLNGAEPIDAPTFERFLGAAESFGLRREAAFPAFGMAELCIAGTFPRRGQGFRTDRVDRGALELDHLARSSTREGREAIDLAVLGRPVPGLEMKVVDVETGADRVEREVGELWVRGTSVTPGYYSRPEATAEAFTDGWLRTGDLAYFVGGELVICGRIKDVMIIGGRNIYPQDIERAVSEVEGVRTGNVIAFGVEGRAGAQQIVVVAETAADPLDEVPVRVSEVVTAETGVPPREVVLVERGTLPKTSSGKLQRSACRADYLAGDLVSV